MLYQRSSDIERRLEAVLALIRKGTHSTPRIAEELRVSIPTVSRDVTALRQRGHEIRSERGDDGWRYLIVKAPAKGRTRRPKVSRATDTRASGAKRR